MKNAFVIVTLSGLLTACAVAPVPPVQEPVALASAEAEEAIEAPEPEDNLPNVELTSELLFKLLKAEFEFRDGNWQGPYAGLMAAARQTRDPRLARRAAEMAMDAKQSGESLAAVRLWRELAPESEDAAQSYLGLAIMTGDLSEAESMLQRRLQESPPAARGLTMYKIQQLLARSPDKAAGAALLGRLLAPYESMFEAQVVLAQAAFARGESKLAEEYARNALRLEPASEIAVLTLAQVSADQTNVSGLLARFLAANPGAREVRAAHARVLVDQKRYAQARQEFVALLADQPDNPATLYALGLMSMQLNDPAAAEGYLARFVAVLDNNPGDERDPAKVLMMLAQLAEERGDYKAAAKWLEQIDEGEPQSWFAAQLKRGQLIGKQGDLQGARAFLAALRVNQPSEQVQVLLGQAHLLREAGQAEAAFKLLEQGIERFPTNPDLLYDYALLAEKTARLDDMEKALRDVMRLAPENHHAYNALGYSLAERNVRLDEALSLIDTALKMAPADPFIMDSMGWVQYRLGKLDEAETYLRKAYALRNDAEIAVHLGEVLWHKGQKADAQKLWREARAKDPKNDTLRSTLSRLQAKL